MTCPAATSLKSPGNLFHTKIQLEVVLKQTLKLHLRIIIFNKEGISSGCLFRVWAYIQGYTQHILRWVISMILIRLIRMIYLINIVTSPMTSNST